MYENGSGTDTTCCWQYQLWGRTEEKRDRIFATADHDTERFSCFGKGSGSSGCLGRSSGGFFYGREEKQRAGQAMEKMQITDLAKRCYRELSGGQQQRVLLARALCATRKMLFLDEPVSGLDPETTREMYRLIEKLNREEQITVIMISHDIEAAQTYASHILDMKALVKRENLQRKEKPENTDLEKGGADPWQN
ncbi:MAG: ATP-binding cassette domain-containing protein [Lachnospiraceae bacterium]